MTEERHVLYPWHPWFGLTVHVAAALGAWRQLALDRVLSGGGRQPAREVALCTAMIVARLIDPAAKLATARQLDSPTATSSLGLMLGLGAVDEQELYGALDWLIEQQPRIEQPRARKVRVRATMAQRLPRTDRPQLEEQ